MPASTWESIRERKQEERESRIPTEWRLPAHLLPHDLELLNVMDVPRKCGLLSPRQLEITEDHDATSLAAAIKAGKFKSVEVAEAFCKASNPSTPTDPLSSSTS